MTRCAVYTRKSTDEGLDQDFNSLDAQRESAEAYIKSQQWECLPDRYDDGGFTGGNMERPALKRLLDDIAAGRVDCVIVYKVDRLSRSLLDFARIIQSFDEHGVSFVSVTQAFDTSSSMGRLTLNVLLSFAQFEREMISERTRDKISAARRRGKYTGGAPILGYDVKQSRLVVNEREAARVQRIFELYLEHRSLLSTAAELNERGWTAKRWTTKKGKEQGGRPFTKTSLHGLLTNVTYCGKTRYRDQVYPGEHDAIVDADVFDRVQRLLVSQKRSGGRRSPTNALLKGRLRCKSCNCAMTHSYTQKGQRRYRYYVCVHAQKRGWSNCPAPSLPAPEIERFVVDQIRSVTSDQAFVEATLAEVRHAAESAIESLGGEGRGLELSLKQASRDLCRVTEPDRLAELHEQIAGQQRRLSEIADETGRLRTELVDEQEVATALREFDGVWGAMSPTEQARVIELLIERVEYDGEHVSVTFRPSGFRLLMENAA